jgi:hypothetical protein
VSRNPISAPIRRGRPLTFHLRGAAIDPLRKVAETLDSLRLSLRRVLVISAVVDIAIDAAVPV